MVPPRRQRVAALANTDSYCVLYFVSRMNLNHFLQHSSIITVSLIWVSGRGDGARVTTCVSQRIRAPEGKFQEQIVLISVDSKTYTHAHMLEF